MLIRFRKCQNNAKISDFQPKTGPQYGALWDPGC